MKRKLTFAGVIMFFALLSSADAAVLTFQFSGSVTGIPFDSAFGDISVGDAIHGSYTFDTSAVDQAPDSSRQGIYKSAGAPFGMTVTIGSHSFSTSGSGIETDVTDNFLGFADIYQIFSANSSGDTSMEFFFTDDTQSVFSNDHLPTVPPSIGAFGERDFLLSFFAGGQQLQLNGRIDALSAQTVPEPSSVALVSLGCLAVAGLAGRKRLLRARSTPE